jgi:hypothetical protein
MKPITLELPESMYADLERIATREHRSIEQYMTYRLHIDLYGQADPCTDEEYAAYIAARGPKYPRINIKAKDRNTIFEASEGKCHHCAGQLLYDEPWHIDHVIPLSKGGSNDKSNLVLSCVRCNLEKGSK